MPSLSLKPPKDLVRVPISDGRSLTSHDLLTRAQNGLRCINWEQIDLALLSESMGSSDSYALSRPVRHGETIDFFLSHSWHDDAQIKFDALSLFAEEFVARNGRSPTFWLDKTCIDQDNIGDGLKVLPVNVMACRKMLVLCGSTYAQVGQGGARCICVCGGVGARFACVCVWEGPARLAWVRSLLSPRRSLQPHHRRRPPTTPAPPTPAFVVQLGAVHALFVPRPRPSHWKSGAHTTASGARHHGERGTLAKVLI